LREKKKKISLPEILRGRLQSREGAKKGSLSALACLPKAGGEAVAHRPTFCRKACLPPGRLAVLLFFLSPIQPYLKPWILLLDVFIAYPGTTVIGLLHTGTVDDRSGVAE